MSYCQQSRSASEGRLRVGFIVNPYAGIGGPAGNKGSDDAAIRARATAGELSLRAPDRARQFLKAIRSSIAPKDLPEFFAAPASMGVNYLHEEALPYTQTGVPVNLPCGAEDTVAQASYLLEAGIDLLIFVGGDGTARDICSVIDKKVPALGVPSGVKMHSGVFAITPDAAAVVLSKLVKRELATLAECEVRDIDEQAFRQGVVRSRWFGNMQVPAENQFVQHVKQGGMEVEELVLLDIAAELRERLDEYAGPVLVIFGPGSTTRFVQEQMGAGGTLLGVDVVEYTSAGEVNQLGSDVDACFLEAVISETEWPVHLVITAIGGQGHIIGRGNQQLSPKVLRMVGKDNTWVIATKTKLKGLNNRPLLIDSGDTQLDSDWAGLIPVVCGYRDVVLYSLGWPFVPQRQVDLIELLLSQCAEKGLPASSQSRRLFHGRGGAHPALQWCCVDWFDPVLLVTLFKAPTAGFEPLLVSGLKARFDTVDGLTVLIQRRYLPSAPIDVIFGGVPAPWFAQRGEQRFFLSARQQNVGFFLDIEPARHWLEQHAYGKRILNLFAYTCVFSVVALKAGADFVVNMDMSKASIAQGRQNHRLNDVSLERVKFLPHNIFKSWGKLRKEGPYDLVVIDPPSYQKGSFIARNDYEKVLRKMAELITDDGFFLACLNAPETIATDFQTLIDTVCPAFEFVERLSPNPDFPDVDQQRALKMLVYKKLPADE